MSEGAVNSPPSQRVSGKALLYTQEANPLEALAFFYMFYFNGLTYFTGQ